jgi:hypothetical protein
MSAVIAAKLAPTNAAACAKANGIVQSLRPPRLAKPVRPDLN